MSQRIVKYKRLRKVKVGDEILGYGTVTVVNGPETGHPGTLQTDTGYRWLSFPEGKSVPVFSTAVWCSKFDRGEREMVQIGTALPMSDHIGTRWMFVAPDSADPGIPVFIDSVQSPDDRDDTGITDTELDAIERRPLHVALPGADVAGIYSVRITPSERDRLVAVCRAARAALSSQEAPGVAGNEQDTNQEAPKA